MLVVGGAGYIGSHAAKYLAKDGFLVIVFDNLSTGFRCLAKYGELVVGDLANIDDINNVFMKHDIDAVFHFAASAYVGESVQNPQKYYKNNVQNTLNLLQVMLQNNVKKIVFSSTCATYGAPEYLPLDEYHPQAPINPYGRTKLMIEQILKDYDKAYSLKYVTLRYFNAAGADRGGELGEMHEPETHLIPLAIRAINPNNTLNVFGDDYDTVDGSCIRDYIHVEDLADAHLKAYEYMCQKNQSNFFNLGTERGYSVLQIINTIEALTNKKVNYQVSPRREGDPSKLVASSKKANEILGWRAKYSDIKSILQNAISWDEGKLP